MFRLHRFVTQETAVLCRDAGKDWCKGRQIAALDTTPEEMKVRVKTGMMYEPFTLTIETKEAYRRIYGTDCLTESVNF